MHIFFLLFQKENSEPRPWSSSNLHVIIILLTGRYKERIHVYISGKMWHMKLVVYAKTIYKTGWLTWGSPSRALIVSGSQQSVEDSTLPGYIISHRSYKYISFPILASCRRKMSFIPPPPPPLGLPPPLPTPPPRAHIQCTYIS